MKELCDIWNIDFQTVHPKTPREAAWAQIEAEAKKTLKRHLAGRRIVDVPPSGGTAADGIGTGHLLTISSPAEGIFASQREVKAFVELRAPFELSRLALSPSKEVLS
ncbi:MAG TPA: family 1 encapsulin nanocompartment shell protein [Bryobacteraceae bacterium]|nr:family 1 encapsulin nanocompartment shell protein [Bryobacteraceae bacterium]